MAHRIDPNADTIDMAEVRERIAELQKRLRRFDADEWPFNHIDWSAAVDELRGEYAEIDFEGSTFYYKD